MKHFAAMGLACLLSACQSSPATLLEGQPDKAADFPTTAADLSDCAYRFAQSMRSPYLFHRHARADNLEFVVTATGSNAPIATTLPKLQLRFITQGETTSVEMRDNAIGDHELSHDVWAVVEWCSQQKTKPSASSIHRATPHH
jgi:hypothetical protein